MALISKLYVLPLLLLLSGSNPPGLSFQEEDGRVSLYQKGELIFSYQVATKSQDGQYPRANYIHPLNDFSGSSITEDFPEDHLHHRGIFWTWHQLYLDDQSLGDPWLCEGVEWQVHDVEHQVDGNNATLTSKVDWKVGTEKQVLVKEAVEMTYRPSKDHYRLDFLITLQSQSDGVALGGSDDIKGYGGFSTRFALGDEINFSDESGLVTAHNEQVDAGNWMLIEDIGKNEVQVAVLYHPQSTADLKGWILREKGSMQNPVWPGRDRVVLNQGEEVTIKAAVVVFQGQPKKGEVEKVYLDFVKG